MYYRKDENTIIIKKGYKDGMKTDAVIYVNSILEKSIEREALNQIINVSTLNGIVGPAIAMPDIHKGYGFPIGGVAAFDIENGIISPGGIGYDINCGVRLISTSLRRTEVEERKKELITLLYSNIPLGVGSEGKLRVSDEDYKELLRKGAGWAIEKGYGNSDDYKNIESNGNINTDISTVTEKAKERARSQLGTLGSGNHFLEVSYLSEIYNEKIAEKLSFFKDQIFVMIHTGSRGFGHQICSDYINIMFKASKKYDIKLYDRELSCAPFLSEEGQRYFNAMNAACNFAWANRQILKDLTEKAFLKVFRISKEMLAFKTIYDLAHNIAKVETHIVNGKERKLIVHRKGATRAFPQGHNELNEIYKDIGQPIIIPGDMGRSSYLLFAKNESMNKSFGSSCHGAGRILSRTKAIEISRRRDIIKELEEKGIFIMANSRDTILEELSDAYKDVDEVVNVVERLGISEKVLKLKPLCVIKG